MQLQIFSYSCQPCPHHHHIHPHHNHHHLWSTIASNVYYTSWEISSNVLGHTLINYATNNHPPQLCNYQLKCETSGYQTSKKISLDSKLCIQFTFFKLAPDWGRMRKIATHGKSANILNGKGWFMQRPFKLKPGTCLTFLHCALLTFAFFHCAFASVSSNSLNGKGWFMHCPH